MYEQPWISRDPKEDYLSAFRQGEADSLARKSRSALAMYGTDPAAARLSAFATGDADTIKNVRTLESQDAEAAKKAQVEAYAGYMDVLKRLRSIPDVARRAQARDQLLTSPSAQFLPPKAIQAARSARMDDEALDLELGAVEAKIYEVEYGKSLVEAAPGRPARELYVRPDKPEYQVVPEGAAAYPVGGTVTRGVIPGAAPAGNTAVPVPAPVSPVTAPVAAPVAPVRPVAARDVPDTLAEAVTSLFPGADIRSTFRTPERNAAVGGVPNSRHLRRGGAVDFIPPRGVSMAEAARQIEARYGGRALNEGDHVHWQPAEALRGGDIDDTLTGAVAPDTIVSEGGVLVSGVAGADTLAGGGQDMISADGRPVLRGPPKPNPDRVTPALAETIRHNRVMEEQAGVRLGRPGGKGLPTEDRKYIAAQRTAAQQMATMATDMIRFVALNEKVPTGPNLGQRVGSRLLDPRFREMESIRDKLTPAMRQGLPGAASDRDVAMFQSATVGTDKTGDTNASIAKAAKAYSRRQLDYVAYLEDYAKRNGTVMGAEEEWGVYAEANPLFGATKDGGLRALPQEPWRKWFGVPAPTGRRGSAPRDGAPRAGGVARMTDAQLKAALGL